MIQAVRRGQWEGKEGEQLQGHLGWETEHKLVFLLG